MIVAVVFRVFYENMTDFCNLLQDQITRALLGNHNLTHVATFGDSNITSTGDWVQILADTIPEVSGQSVLIHVQAMRL